MSGINGINNSFGNNWQNENNSVNLQKIVEEELFKTVKSSSGEATKIEDLANINEESLNTIVDTIANYIVSLFGNIFGGSITPSEENFPGTVDIRPVEPTIERPVSDMMEVSLGEGIEFISGPHTESSKAASFGPVALYSAEDMTETDEVKPVFSKRSGITAFYVKGDINDFNFPMTADPNKEILVQSSWGYPAGKLHYDENGSLTKFEALDKSVRGFEIMYPFNDGQPHVVYDDQIQWDEKGKGFQIIGDTIPIGQKPGILKPMPEPMPGPIKPRPIKPMPGPIKPRPIKPEVEIQRFDDGSYCELETIGGRSTKRTYYNADGSLIHTIEYSYNKNGSTTETVIEPEGNVSQITNRNSDGKISYCEYYNSDGSLWRTSNHEYSEDGIETITERDPNGTVRYTCMFDSINQQMIAQDNYDEEGNLATHCGYEYAEDGSHTETTYDKDGNILGTAEYNSEGYLTMLDGKQVILTDNGILTTSNDEIANELNQIENKDERLAKMIQYYVTQMEDFGLTEEAALHYFDFDGDGEVSVLDATSLQRKVAKEKDDATLKEAFAFDSSETNPVSMNLNVPQTGKPNSTVQINKDISATYDKFGRLITMTRAQQNETYTYEYYGNSDKLKSEHCSYGEDGYSISEYNENGTIKSVGEYLEGMTPLIKNYSYYVDENGVPTQIMENSSGIIVKTTIETVLHKDPIGDVGFNWSEKVRCSEGYNKNHPERPYWTSRNGIITDYTYNSDGTVKTEKTRGKKQGTFSQIVEHSYENGQHTSVESRYDEEDNLSEYSNYTYSDDGSYLKETYDKDGNLIKSGRYNAEGKRIFDFGAGTKKYKHPVTFNGQTLDAASQEAADYYNGIENEDKRMAEIIQRYLSGMNDFNLTEEDAIKMLDFDGDGEVSAIDTTLLLRRAAEEPTYSILVGDKTFTTKNKSLADELNKIKNEKEKFAQMINQYVRGKDTFGLDKEEAVKLFDQNEDGEITTVDFGIANQKAKQAAKEEANKNLKTDENTVSEIKTVTCEPTDVIQAQKDV